MKTLLTGLIWFVLAAITIGPAIAAFNDHRRKIARLARGHAVKSYIDTIREWEDIERSRVRGDLYEAFAKAYFDLGADFEVIARTREIPGVKSNMTMRFDPPSHPWIDPVAVYARWNGVGKHPGLAMPYGANAKQAIDAAAIFERWNHPPGVLHPDEERRAPMPYPGNSAWPPPEAASVDNQRKRTEGHGGWDDVSPSEALRAVTPRAYECPVCGVADPNAYLRCNRGDCTDGRDPR